MTRTEEKERRRLLRHPLGGVIRILWEDADGCERVSRVQCVDISPTGARFRCTERVPSRTMVLFNCPELGVAGRGSVRYCQSKGAAYEIGIECIAGTGSRNVFGRLKSEIGLPPESKQTFGG